MKDAHDADGVRTIIKTLSDIGSDNPEDIREYIRDAYNNWGIDYVLLGGDDDIIPSRTLYFGTDLQEEYGAGDMFGPSDLYYACLDGSWNIPKHTIPDNKDISIADPGINGKGDGIFSDPIIDPDDKVIGSDSQAWTFTNRGNNGTLYVTFNPPLNLSDMNWLHFNIKKTKGFNIILFLPMIADITLHSRNGSEIHSVPSKHSIFVAKSWEEYHLYLPSFKDTDVFNWTEIDSISFTIFRILKRNCIGEKIFLDGLYFSDWRDDCWGEPDENEDLFAEINVGRACVDDVQDVENFVQKTLQYILLNPEDTYLKKVLLVGQYLGHGGSSEWGSAFLNELIDGSSEHNYTTVGIPSSNYSITKLYDGEWAERDWRKPPGLFLSGGWLVYLLLSEINKNTPHLIINSGHGDVNKALKMCNIGIYRMRNQKPFFCIPQHVMSDILMEKRIVLPKFLVLKQSMLHLLLLQMHDRDGVR